VRRVAKTREEPCSRGADDGHTHGRSQGSALGRTEMPTRRRGRPGRGGGGQVRDTRAEEDRLGRVGAGAEEDTSGTPGWRRTGGAGEKAGWRTGRRRRC
jgi:hypothetical protein